MIEPSDIDRLKEIFVTRQECGSNTGIMNDRIAEYRAEIAVIKQQLKTITWILTAVGGGVITMMIKMFFGA